jgi:membrane fusion protein, multidrug efflux system
MTFTLPNRNRLKHHVAAIAATATLVLAGCANYSGIKSDKTLTQPQQLETSQSIPAEAGQWPTLDWANQFGDPQLPKLIDEALEGNPTIAQAQARIAKASSYIETSKSALSPKVEASYSWTRELYSANGLFPPPFGGSWYSENNTLASASWELDLWGKNRQRLAQAVSEKQAAEADMQQARVTLAASVARTYNQLALLYALRDIAAREIDNRTVSGMYADNDQYRAQVAQRESDLAKAQDDLQRRLAVAQTGAVSQEDVSHARDAVNSAQASLDATRQQLTANLALTTNTTAATHPDVQAAAAAVRDAYLANARNTLPAPVSGYVAKRSVQVGQRVAPGTPLMSVVPLGQIWVDANFKEVQLKHMRVGQPVELTADVYGSSVTYHGKVVGFSAGTGSAFSLLPAQNATGNWIKVVQRLPVRVALDEKELEAHPLRIGLSMQVDVTTRNETGGELGNVPNSGYQTDVFARYGNDADAEIARIIVANASGSTNRSGNAASQQSASPSQRSLAKAG